MNDNTGFFSPIQSENNLSNFENSSSNFESSPPNFESSPLKFENFDGLLSNIVHQILKISHQFLCETLFLNILFILFIYLQAIIISNYNSYLLSKCQCTVFNL